MSNPIKAGLALGIAGGLIIAFYGGLSGILAGLVGGAVVGLLLSNWDDLSKADIAVRETAIGGAFAGVLMIIGQLVHDFVILPL